MAPSTRKSFKIMLKVDAATFILSKSKILNKHIFSNILKLVVWMINFLNTQVTSRFSGYLESVQTRINKHEPSSCFIQI